MVQHLKTGWLYFWVLFLAGGVEAGFTAEVFLRGDTNMDRTVDVSDAIEFLN